MASSDNFADTLVLVAPTGGVVAGTMIKVQGIICLPLLSAAVGASFPAKVVGRIYQAKAAGSQVWVPGQKLYWVTASSQFSTASTGNTAAGYAAAAKLSADVVGDVLLLQA